ncbi:MAG: hypothetical protein K2L16_05585 [Muribaculaceae bacterium]|nr:hypothetical protein [Muribaculaceae bacterium]
MPNYRAPWHDYTSRCIYMITINKSPRCPSFGKLEGSPLIPAGQAGSSFIQASHTGSAIKQALMGFPRATPEARVLQYAIMPDHIHFLLFIQEPTEEILGRIIARFKVEVDRLSGVEQVFDKGFNDQILKPSRSLDVLYRYIRDNPRRLAVRRMNPDFFRRVNLEIGGKLCPGYGNPQLLDNPFKEQVVVHRADSASDREHKRQLWLYTAANGGVLVSPFISPAEKAIRAEAEELGGRLILISNETMGERFKPSGHDFGLCEAGRMLIISSEDFGSTLSRSVCLSMNAFAARVATA